MTVAFFLGAALGCCLGFVVGAGAAIALMPIPSPLGSTEEEHCFISDSRK